MESRTLLSGIPCDDVDSQCDVIDAGEVSSPAPLAALSEFADPNPNPDNQFGDTIVTLDTGNVVITSPLDDAGGSNAGAVYLFDGSTGALISTITGADAFAKIGSGGVTALSNGNFVFRSPEWRDAASPNLGAVTFANGTTGITGVVSASNSLVGTTINDRVGNRDVTSLGNGNYVVQSTQWNNGGIVGAGAVTFGNGITGISGAVSVANSLVGTSTNDQIGAESTTGITVLSNGNYVVQSRIWDNGAAIDAGAVTFGNGMTGVTGPVSASNSLVGTTSNDIVGTQITALNNGNYVVGTTGWDNGTFEDAGAATFGNGTTGVSGVVSAGNSLVGTAAFDRVGGITALTNGNYVIRSGWTNGMGAVTFADGTVGISGVISASNSLVGEAADDGVGAEVTALSNGNYVVVSRRWRNGTVHEAGAATFGNGTTGISGVVNAGNSLVGTSPDDTVGRGGVTELSNGNYVVTSWRWNNGTVGDAGAVTFGNGSTGVSGEVSAANSLIGTSLVDNVGRGGVTPLTNGNYVVTTFGWDDGAIQDVGAATFGNGTTGVSGVISAANSLIGSTEDDGVGVVTPLTNGNYVVTSILWDNGASTNAGAATFGNGATGTNGVVSAGNSFVGSTTQDLVGFGGVAALSNGNYVVISDEWNNGTATQAGATTFGNGTTHFSGEVAVTNSLVGTSIKDHVGNEGVTALNTGNYVVSSGQWDNGSAIDAGAVTFGSGVTGVSGPVSASNSVVGTQSQDRVGSGGITVLSGSALAAGNQAARIGTPFDSSGNDDNFVIRSNQWDNGGLANAGAATFGSGITGISGPISSGNSIVGLGSNTNLQPVVFSPLSEVYVASFTDEDNGKVRVGENIVTNTPDIDVEGNGFSIVSGDSTPDSSDNTDFGLVDISAGSAARTFTVSNTGTGELTLDGTPRVAVSGTNSAEFVVTSQPNATVSSSGGTTTFTVEFDPGAPGLRTATISIDSDDPDEDPYNFTIQGTGIALPEIDVQGNGVSIADGDIDPNGGNNTEFGLTDVTGGTVTHSFTIENTGLGTLQLDGTPRVTISGVNSSDFSVVIQPSATVAASGGTTTFDVEFNPTVVGVRQATVNISNNDTDENPYNFNIHGIGTSAPEIDISGNGVSIADGDTTPDLANHTDFGFTGTAGPIVTRTFTITNNGLQSLSLNGTPRVAVSGTHAADFTVTSQPSTVVAPTGGTTTFTIDFAPSIVGLRMATITIDNDDPDEDPYNFSIQGFAAAELIENELSNLNGTNGFRLDGVAAGDSAGSVVRSAGDVNGDGFDDVIVGARFPDANGADAGASYVVFGAASGFPASVNLSTLDGSNGFRLDGVAAGDSAGVAVSSGGDINGDGFDDLIVGAFLADPNGTSSGASYVVFGASAGFGSSVNLSSLDGSSGFRLEGVADNDLTGISVRHAGDVNGDGLDDVIVGAFRADPNGTDSGSSYVIFGSTSSFGSTINLATLDGSNGFRLDGAAAGDESGVRVSGAGDFNADGFDDVLIGARFVDANGVDSGANYIVFGASGGFASAINLSTLNGTTGFRLAGETAGDNSGISVSAAGDVNGDGFDDVIISSVLADNTASNSGSSYVVFGAAGGFGSTMNLSSLDGSTGFRLDGVSADDQSGTRVAAAGDVNADGFDDLIIGARFADPNGSSSGSSYVFYGASGGFGASINLSSLSGATGFVLNGVATDDQSGISVSGAGDVNGDGFDDVIVGAWHADPNGTDSGSSYVVFGGNLTGGVETQVGDNAANTLTATQGAGIDILIGGQGPDTLISDGGDDVLRGGEGDDSLSIPDTTFSPRRLLGGNGTDTLILSGSGLTFDLTTLPDNRVVDIEEIDITGSGDNTLTLDVQEVLNISSHSNTLIVRRGFGDTVNIGTGWTQQSNENIGPDLFEVFTQGAATLKVQSDASSTIAGRHLFYNNSRFDDPVGEIGDPLVNANDDGAIANKVALQAGTPATNANYSSYSRGINGIMIDIANAPGTLTAADFSFAVGNTATPFGAGWTAAPAPNNGFDIRPGEGDGGSDRITFTWGDGVIQNEWLQVTVKANGNTGLATDDVHYWGNQLGETGNDATTAVNFNDTLLVLNNPSGFTPAPITSAYDIDRDGRVNFTDTLLVLNNPSGFSSLLLFNPPAPPPPPAAPLASLDETPLAGESTPKDSDDLSAGTSLIVAEETKQIGIAPNLNSYETTLVPVRPIVVAEENLLTRPSDAHLPYNTRAHITPQTARHTTSVGPTVASKSDASVETVLPTSYFTEDEQSRMKLKLTNQLRRKFGRNS